MRRDIFQAIADPTRREIIQLLSQQPLNLNAVAENFNVSRPAISKHVKILDECGLLNIHKDGRQRICIIQVDKLKEVSVWVEQFRKLWENRLDNLDFYLNQIQSTKK